MWNSVQCIYAILSKQVNMQARGLRPGDWNFTTEINKGVEDFYVYFDSILSSRKPADNINVHCKFTEVNLSTTVLLKYSMLSRLSST